MKPKWVRGEPFWCTGARLRLVLSLNALQVGDEVKLKHLFDTVFTITAIGAMGGKSAIRIRVGHTSTTVYLKAIRAWRRPT